MKYLLTIALFACALLIGACNGSRLSTEETELKESVEATAKEAAAKKGEQMESPKILGDWKEVRSKDSYNDGDWQNMEREKVISFSKKNNAYTEKDKENDACHGFYSLIGMTLVLEHSCNNARLTYEVVEATDEKLVLGIQGRHGQVLYEFVKI
jgi:hypothetical protein